ncbi:hypothetical protein D9M68_908640 [compost metagenome]
MDFSVEKMSSDHADIVAAIKNQDMDRAEYYAHKHAEQFKGRFMQFLNRSYTNKVSLQYSGRPELVAEA